MTVAELMIMLRDSDPTDIVTIAFYTRHGDSGYYTAQGVINSAIVEIDGEDHNAIVIGCADGDDVYPKELG